MRLGRFTSLILPLLAPLLLQALAIDRDISQYIHEAWIDKDGLPVNTVLAVTQTPDGYLWLATEEGLVRFDGMRFTIFTEETVPEIPSRHILRLLVDRRGRLWIGTYNGAALFDGDHFERPPCAGLQGTTVFGFAESRDGTLWITTADGLFSLRNGRYARFGVEQGFPNNDFQMPQIDRDNALWVVSGRTGLCRFKPEERPACTSYDEIIRSFFIDNRGRFWLGTYTSMALLNPQGKEEQRLSDGTPLYADQLFEDRDGNLWFGSRERELVRRAPDGRLYPNDRSSDRIGPVMALFEDRERNLWVGTGGNGLHRFSDSKIALYTTKNGLDTDIILPVYRSRDNDILFATYSGTLAAVRAGQVKLLDGFRAAIGNAMVLSLLEARDGTLWISTQGRGLFRALPGDIPRRFPLPVTVDTIPAVYEDQRGALWILARGEGVLRWQENAFTQFTMNDGLPDNFMRLIRESADGDLWFASSTGGLSVYRDGRFIESDRIFDRPLPTKAIQTLYIDALGLLWISTNGNGLFVWDGELLTPVRFQKGLTTSLVLGIVEDRSHNLWMSTNRGILRVERSETALYLKGAIPRISPLIFTTAHGLKSAECVGGTQQSADRGRDGKLYFATVGGLAAIDPENLPTNTVQPPVRIEQAIVNNEPLSLTGQPLAFTRGIERLEIRYTALSFINPAYITFKYRLNGFDRDWVAAGTQRSAHYTNLPPGNYQFTVIAANSDGIWNQSGTTLSFTIDPLFYQTGYFHLLVVLGIALAVYVIFLIRIRTVRSQNLRLSVVVEEKTRELTVANQTLREMSLIDPLTGLRNRRYFTEILKAEATSYLRGRSHAVSGSDPRGSDREKVWGIFLLDIDHFKQVNDRFGHDSGDLILTQVSQLLKQSVRADDVVLRWGGEEFLIVLKNSAPEYLGAYAGKVRHLIENTFLRTAQGDLIHKTISVGLTRLPFYLDQPERINIEQAISVADLALYHAKKHGRNRAFHILPGGRIADTAPEEMQHMLTDLDTSLKQGFFSIAER